MINQSNFFDLQDILLNELVGDTYLFLFLGLFLILVVCLKSKMPKEIPIILCMAWVSLIFSILGDGIMIIWVLMILGVAVIAALANFKTFER